MPEAEIARILFAYGEEPRSRRIASEIVRRRQSKPLTTTEDLSKMTSPEHVLVAESGIFTLDDVVRLEATGATAMLVGESLMRQADVTLATRTLLGVEA